MSFDLSQWGAVVAGLLVIAIETIYGRLRCGARRGLLSLWIGVGLLLVGAFMAATGPRNPLYSLPPLNRPLTRHFVRETICFQGGYLFVVLGAVWLIASAASRRQIRRLDEDMTLKDEEISATREVVSSIIRTSVSGVMILDAIRDEAGVVTDFKCRFMNDEAERLLERDASALLGKPLLAHVPSLKEKGLFYEALNVLERRVPFRDERRCRDEESEKWYQIAIVKHGDGLITTFTDVSERKRTEKKLRHAARYDALTDLPSRSLLIDRIAEAIVRRRRMPDYTFAVLALDLDRFKIINESLGHKVGDQLLISVAGRLRANLRALDTHTRFGGEDITGRLGGDEFVILLDGVQDARAALVVAERVREALAVPHTIEGHEVTSTASIGVVTSDGEYEQPEDILRDADTAMYQAKSSDKAEPVIFNEHMHREVLERLTLEKELRLATEAEQFKLNYQPIITMETGALRGFEALIRWPHPERGMVRPDMFIGLAEELGLIIPIGLWVLREACEQLKRWQEQRPGQPIAMTVNLSKKQLADPGLVNTVAEVIKEIGIEPRSLCLEITESTIMDNLDEFTPILSGLHDIGVRLAMDDFGTGHSSLSFLHRVPMDILKIDRSFINRTGEGRKYEAIVETIVRLAHNLDMAVVAEGIETTEQMTLLRKLNCNYAQGYLFSKPLDAPDAEEYIDTDYRFSVAA